MIGYRIRENCVLFDQAQGDFVSASQLSILSESILQRQ